MSINRFQNIVPPPIWSDEQLEADRLLAAEVFRRTRMEEPLEQYLRHFEQSQESMEDLIETTVDLSLLADEASYILTDQRLMDSFRFLASPFVSVDDLKTLADTNSLIPARIGRDPDLANRLVAIIRSGIDRRRFPWVTEGREPTPSERDAAILATAAIMATSKTQTERRNEGKKEQERKVHEALIESGLQEIELPRGISALDPYPSPGTFTKEIMVGTRKADIVVSLWDGRLLPIECKVSNSSTNSIKRINNDAAVKATEWRKEFGESRIVPAATLSGVYKLRNLTYAQDRGLTLFWAHGLSALTEWISSTQR